MFDWNTGCTNFSLLCLIYVYLQMSANMSEIPLHSVVCILVLPFGSELDASVNYHLQCLHCVHPWEKGAWVTFSKMRFLLLCIHYIYLHIQILWLGVVIGTLPMKYSMLKSLPENVGIREENGSSMFSVIMPMTCHYL